MPTGSQASNNFDAFESRFGASLEAVHLSRFALMHNGEVVDIFDDKIEPFDAGLDRFGLGRFSFHEIGARPAHVGALASTMAWWRQR